MEILFSPKSVAVIGASSNPIKWGNWIAEQVIVHKDVRHVYFVNPKGEEIFGQQSLTNIQDIPEPLDVAIVCVPLKSFEDTIDALLVHGTKVIVAITAGFAEVDNRGFQIERRVVERVHNAGSILIGPNCAGVWDSYSPFWAMSERFQAGPVAMISQSGGIVMDVASRLADVQLGFSRVISVGNNADCRMTEMLHCFDRDPNTKVIAMYIEDERTIPYHVFKTLSKPVVLLTPDTGPTAREASKRHTASALSNSQYVAEATRANGGYYAKTISEFVALIQLNVSGQKANGNRVMIVSDTGGLAIMLTSALEHTNATFAKLSDETLEKINGHVKSRFPQVVVSNPIDLINVDGGFTEATSELMDILQRSDDCDIIIMSLHLESSSSFKQQQIVYRMLSSIRLGKKPVLFTCRHLDAVGMKDILADSLPVYRDVEMVMVALEALI